MTHMNANENENELPPIRTFSEWTANYVRRGVREGFLTTADAERFAAAFGDGMTLAELGAKGES